MPVQLTVGTYVDVIRSRRSIRKLTHGPDIDEDVIRSVIETALFVPSAFNMQSGRLVVLLGDNHNDFWEIVKQGLLKTVSPDRVASTEQRMNGFIDGGGTVLFFEDDDTLANMRARYPSNAALFDEWSQQGSGMLQFVVWTGLTNIGLGASLQHYNFVEQQAKNDGTLPRARV